VMQLISRILSIVEPYPAPPFDVGLEASQLMGSLPDTISMPLRQSLSGLMTDLAISEGSAQPVSAQELAPTTVQSRPQAVDAGLSAGPEISSIKLSDAFNNVIPQTISLLLASYRDRVGCEANAKYAANPPIPSEGLQRTVKLCWALGSTGEVILEQLLTTMLQQVIPDANGLKAHNVDACMLLLEGLPDVLRWWKDQSDGLAYPVCLPKSPVLC
jgi:mediator of RNA polymerase II transcription subunit 5